MATTIHCSTLSVKPFVYCFTQSVRCLCFAMILLRNSWQRHLVQLLCECLLYVDCSNGASLFHWLIELLRFHDWYCCKHKTLSRFRDGWELCLSAPRGRRWRNLSYESSNLVDPASSHTLVSKIKPCMCKYKQFYTVKLRMAHYISYSLFDSILLLG